MKSKLINIDDVSLNDWEHCGIDADLFARMMNVQKNEEDVTIEFLETEGEFGYYQVTLPDGGVIDGLDGYHLSTIHELKEMLS
jgi:hypothetical protein